MSSACSLDLIVEHRNFASGYLTAAAALLH